MTPWNYGKGVQIYWRIRELVLLPSPMALFYKRFVGEKIPDGKVVVERQNQIKNVLRTERPMAAWWQHCWSNKIKIPLTKTTDFPQSLFLFYLSYLFYFCFFIPRAEDSSSFRPRTRGKTYRWSLLYRHANLCTALSTATLIFVSIYSATPNTNLPPTPSHQPIPIC